MQKAEEMKQQKQEKKNSAKEMKRAGKLIVQTNRIAKPKRQYQNAELETDGEDETNIRLRESFFYLLRKI